MNCEYCGNAGQATEAFCAGCGAPRTRGVPSASDAQATVYEQIGRAVVNREPNEALDRLLSVGERRNASTGEQRAARAAKLILFGLLLYNFPAVLMPLFGIGIMFFMWIYLPYQGIRKVLGWLSS